MWTTALIMTPSPCPNSQVPLFVLSRLLSSLWVSHTGSASDWCALQEALYKCIDTIQYNTIMLVNIAGKNYLLILGDPGIRLGATHPDIRRGGNLICFLYAKCDSCNWSHDNSWLHLGHTLLVAPHPNVYHHTYMLFMAD